MSPIVVLLAVNAILHGIVIARHGVRGNEPFLVFGLVYAALAVAVYRSVSHALAAAFIVSIVGIAGLTVTFKKQARDKTLDKAIWALDAVTILYVGYLLFVA